jgi:hypothetical protein
MFVLGAVGVVILGAGALKAASEAGLLNDPTKQYPKNAKPTPPRVGYS